MGRFVCFVGDENKDNNMVVMSGVLRASLQPEGCKPSRNA